MMEEKFNSVEDVTHYHVIMAHAGYGAALLEYKKWDTMNFEMMMRWTWYFKYRAALLQVKYPKATVEHRWGHEAAVGKTLEYIVQKRMQGKRATITKYRNLIKKAEDTWNYLFPITDDVLYKKAIAKIERLENEYNLMIQDQTHEQI